MKRTVLCLLAVLLAQPVFLLSPVSVCEAGEGEENTYIVRSGDTLSGIAGELLGDANRWSELLEANPQITDPQLIYPGDALVVPGLPAEKPADAIAVSSGSEVKESEKVFVEDPPELPVEVVTPADIGEEDSAFGMEDEVRIPVINSHTYQASGYIATALPETAVVASVADKITLGQGDEIFLGTIADEGTMFTIVRPVRKVYHPRTQEDLGWLIRVLGWAEVNCPGETSSRAMLGQTVDSVQIGDLALPFDPEDVLEQNIIGPRQSTFCLEKAEEGLIVATQEPRLTQGEGDVVFLDRGEAEGVKPGDMFVVYRDVPPGNIEVIAQLQVIRVGARTSAALVIHSMEEIEVNDLVQTWEPPVSEEPSVGG
jgi:LysM repeat protein